MRGDLVIFTDLDGTLLDAGTYSFGPAVKALGLLDELGVPLVICTSKTRAEILYWRARLNNRHPFISENGGGIYIPRGYFRTVPPAAKEPGGYQSIALGAPYERLREGIASLRAEGFDVRGFGDMTPEEVAGLTGLTQEQARMAMDREYDEPFVHGGGDGSLPELYAAIARIGLRHTAGRLMHLLGDSDKGKAVKILTGLYRREYGEVVTAALGDGQNDGPMLAAVDYPFLVMKPGGSHEPSITDGRVSRVRGVGPEGWAQAVEGLLEMLGAG